jgi:hypothetical protein
MHLMYVIHCIYVAPVEILYFAGHYALWQAGVLHRDVSPGNLMWYWGEDDTLVGVLNDYDLSSLATVHGPDGNERTGTVPFMALDLLTAKGQRGEVKHLYRHDLESFMWVLVWISLRYKDGQLLPLISRPFDKWATLPAEECGEKKASFLNAGFDHACYAIDQRIWELVVDCFHVLDTESSRRRRVYYEQQQQAGKDGQIMGEAIELDDCVILNLFRTTPAWVDLKESLQ